METLSLGLPFIAAFLDPGAWGREFTTALDSYVNMAGMWLVGEDMPQETNRITLSDAKDQWGLAVANVHFDDHPNDLAMRAYGYKQGAAIYDAVGFYAPAFVVGIRLQFRSAHGIGPARLVPTQFRRVSKPIEQQ